MIAIEIMDNISELYLCHPLLFWIFREIQHNMMDPLCKNLHKILYFK
jgi:hypothetical protein